MGDVKLLPCPNPWCGGEENSVTEFEVWFYIGCDYCGLRGPARKSEEAARAEWNTRPAPSLTPAQQAAEETCEALKNLLADIEDYQTINNLGGSDNCTQVAARAALAKAGKP